MSCHDRIQLENSWKERLLPEFEKPYMLALRAFLIAEKEQKKRIFPPSSEIFQAFAETPFSEVKVVILGQDPYHGFGQAHGLCFSVKPGTPLPPSLQNIYKEMRSDLGIVQPSHGYLVSWARQGVLLLNAVLTVEEGNAGSHQNRGWETFTDAAIAALQKETQHLVFLLWGSYAQRKGQSIDRKRHLVLTAPHPSPLSAHRGFLGCRHFSQTNHYLKQVGQIPIEWQLPALPLEKQKFSAPPSL